MVIISNPLYSSELPFQDLEMLDLLPTLFKPLKIGNFTISHRVGMAPMGRFRSDAKVVPTDLMVEYYAQRSSTPGTLIITEGGIVHPKADGMPFLPGIWNKEQIVGWKKVNT